MDTTRVRIRLSRDGSSNRRVEHLGGAVTLCGTQWLPSTRLYLIMHAAGVRVRVSTHLCSAACFLSRLAAVNTAQRVMFCCAASPNLFAERSRMRCRSYRSAVCPMTCAQLQHSLTGS